VSTERGSIYAPGIVTLRYWRFNYNQASKQSINLYSTLAQSSLCPPPLQRRCKCRAKRKVFKWHLKVSVFSTNL